MAPIPPKIMPFPDSLFGSVDDTTSWIVVFRDTISIPAFPMGNPSLPRTHPSNVHAMLVADSLSARLLGQRSAQFGEDSTALRTIPGVTPYSRFWLIQGMVVNAPVSAIAAIAALPQVTYVRPVKANERPPDCSETGAIGPNTVTGDNVVTLGKERGLEAYRASYGGGWLGVLDTGVCTEHAMLLKPFASGTSSVFYDCADACPDRCLGTSTMCTDCPTASVSDDCGHGHGTSTAAILVGDNTSYPDYLGLTTAALDWFSVYDQSKCNDPKCGVGKESEAVLDACAAVRGFEHALRRTDPVIVAEVAAEESDQGPVARAAARAFDANRVIIAAAGNGPGGTQATSPAIEATAFAVGARDYDSWLESTPSMPEQRYGRVDGRMKPDLLGPSNTETASRCTKYAFYEYGYTSGATPYVGAAALQLHNWLQTTFSVTDPGHTYAQLVLSGSTIGPFTNETAGAGLMTLNDPSLSHWIGKVELTSGGMKPVSIPIGSTTDKDLVAAIWWPEPLPSTGPRPHHAMTLRLVDPGGTTTESNDATGVFQRVVAPLAGTTPCSVTIRWRLRWYHFWFFWIFYLEPVFTVHCWTLEIEAGPMPAGVVQTVYYAVVRRP